MAKESKSSAQRRYFQTMISREVQLIANNIAQLLVSKLGQKILQFRIYDHLKFVRLNCLLLTIYVKRQTNFFNKKSEILGKHSQGIWTSFAYMSDSPTPNLGHLGF